VAGRVQNFGAIRGITALLAALLLALGGSLAWSADIDASMEPALDTITVVATGVSNMTSASAGDIGLSQIASEPLLRPAAILENIPGLIVTQHSGEGKANQYFLRAFNLDHGTDFALQVDDMPVNMPSHAHGQGYADFNFVIPELVDDLHYKKGPYYADEGDFATAGTARVGLVNGSSTRITTGFGEAGYRRGLVVASTDVSGGTMIAAAEVYHNDGPFDVPDDYNRLNGVLRYHRGEEDDYFTVTAMGYAGRWNSTDQVPQRAILDGTLDRFGSLNPSDGGVSNRYSLSASKVERSQTGQLDVSAYLIKYKLDLWSTFTYYLKNPDQGDQMLQHDDRIVYGFKAAKSWFTRIAGLPMSNVLGVQTRIDDIRDVGLFPSFERQTLSIASGSPSGTQNASVLESTGALYAENSIHWREDVQTVIGLREDVYDFDVKDKLLNADGSCNLQSDPLGCDTGNKRASITSPKFGLILGPWAKTTVFLNAGSGFHSNDARGVTRSGESRDAAAASPLTRATGAEVGIATTLIPGLEARIDFFRLHLKSELVFSGDAGVTEPNGASTRTGVEWGSTLHLNSWLSADLNAAVTRARFDRNADADDLGCADAAASNPCASAIAVVGRYIPNSPTNVIGAGLTAQRESGWFGAVHLRHFGSAPLTEDNSAKSPAYTTIDAQLGFRGRQWLIAMDVFNLADVKWNDIEYYYVSRLKNEASPSADYIVHAGVPRTLRARAQYQF
jgi:TonB dependent receptor/TonB-dependent Receptor Plug Domain